MRVLDLKVVHPVVLRIDFLDRVNAVGHYGPGGRIRRFRSNDMGVYRGATVGSCRGTYCDFVVDGEVVSSRRFVPSLSSNEQRMGRRNFHFPAAGSSYMEHPFGRFAFPNLRCLLESDASVVLERGDFEINDVVYSVVDWRWVVEVRLD